MTHVCLTHRACVLWIGGELPRKLSAECAEWQLEVTKISYDQLGAFAPRARALLLELPSASETFECWVLNVVRLARDHGVGVYLVLANGAGTLARGRMPEHDVVMQFGNQVKYLRTRYTDIDVPAHYDASLVIREAYHCALGPGASTAVQLHGDPCDPAVEILVRRAFHDCRCVTLRRMSGGLSGAGVWLVQCEELASAGRHLHSVIKVQPASRSQLERTNARLIRARIEGRLRASVVDERSVSGDSISLITYEHVTRSEPLLSSLPRGQGMVISSLFTHTLSGLYAAAETHARVLQHDFGPHTGNLDILRWSYTLSAAAAAAHTDSAVNAMDPSLVLSYECLQRHVSALSPVHVATAYVHGDLHCGNVFVGPGSEAILIDYDSVQADRPLVADAATLEVSLVWPSVVGGRDRRLLVSREWLHSAYRYPLRPQVPFASDDAEWVSSAVCAIRKEIAVLDTNPAAYALAVAFNLLRFASYEDNGTAADRALAYSFASQLITAASASDDGARQETR